MVSEGSDTVAVREQSPSLKMHRSVTHSSGVQQNGAANPSPADDSSIDRGSKKPPSREDVEEVLVKANELAQSMSRKLSFSYDNRIEKVIVRVTEGDSEKVIRQLPPEEMIRLSLQMKEMMGMLINQSI